MNHLEDKVLSGIMESIDIGVPDDFAERIMQKISRHERAVVNDWFDNLQDWLEKKLAIPAYQLVFLFLGISFSFFNLFKFVFYIIIPA